MYILGWSAVMWAVFMVEQEHKMVGAEHAKRKQLCDVINYLVLTVQGAQVTTFVKRDVLYDNICQTFVKRDVYIRQQTYPKQWYGLVTTRRHPHVLGLF